MSPITAVYEAIKESSEKSPSEKVEFMLISSESHFLKEMFEDTKVPYKVINAPRSKKLISPESLFDIPRGIASFFAALKYVFDYMPDVIFSKGGNVSFPVVIAGWLFRIPIIIHESDSVPRLLDKLMSRFAAKIAISFPQSKEFYNPSKVFFTGNPVRKFIIQGNKERGLKDFVLKTDKPIILIMGGSEGADEINNLVLEIIPDLLQSYQIIHQCGIGNYEKTKALVEKMNIPNLNDYHLFPFFKKRIADAYAVCDLIISRAGANTVSEIMVVRKPSILIPFLFSVSDKQTKNAYYYSEAGAAVLISEKNLKPHLLLNVINDLFKEPLKILEMQRAAREMAHFRAADKIAEEILKL